MTYWETAHAVAGLPPTALDYAGIWQAAAQVVYSMTLVTASTAQTRIERDFDPEEVRDMKASADRDLSVGGPGLAARAIESGLVDELHRFITPIVVGGGTRWLPHGVRIELELADERRFDSGVVFLRYRTRT